MLGEMLRIAALRLHESSQEWDVYDPPPHTHTHSLRALMGSTKEKMAQTL